ncbi:MAG TPA: hypothetical protein PKD12_14695 [Nitrospira sp.]|nr:hypothetical protein [Nitrospira sp.]
MDDQKEIVRRVLKDAFAEWRADLTNPILTHDECLDMRTKLLSVHVEDVECFLSQVLEDLLDTHTGKASNSEDVESVVDFLDVPTSGNDVQFWKERLDRERFEHMLNLEEELRSEKYTTFKHITPLQARALCAWLEYARTWADLEWNIEQVNSALAYWTKRAQVDQISDALADEVIGLLEKLNGGNRYWDSLYWEFQEDATQLFVRVLLTDSQNNPENIKAATCILRSVLSPLLPSNGYMASWCAVIIYEGEHVGGAIGGFKGDWKSLGMEC